MRTLLSYLQSPMALPFGTALLVALIRKHWSRVDGLGATVLCSAVVGAALAALQLATPAIVVWLAAHPAVAVPVDGAIAAVLAMSGASLLQWLAALVPGLQIDTGGTRAPTAEATAVIVPPPPRTPS